MGIPEPACQPTPSDPDDRRITLDHGRHQRFQFRTADINILGAADVGLPVRLAEYRLNGGSPSPLYVEPDQGEVPVAAHDTTSVLRLGRPGQFNIEIPVNANGLKKGANALDIQIDDAGGERHQAAVEIWWEPSRVMLPLELGDLSRFASIQDVGQVVDGAFEIDRPSNSIRTKSPVAADALLLLGSVARSQEATYDVVFSEWQPDTVFAGASDFFVSHDSQDPGLAIKPGYSTAGLVTIRPSGIAETWLMRGALLRDHDWIWRQVDRFPVSVQPGIVYSVRHRLILEDEFNWVRFKIWEKDTPEPARWSCDSDTAAVSSRYKRFSGASFGLFQYGGQPTAWSNIQVREVEVDDAIRRAISRRSSRAKVAWVRASDWWSSAGTRAQRLQGHVLRLARGRRRGT